MFHLPQLEEVKNGRYASSHIRSHGEVVAVSVSAPGLTYRGREQLANSGPWAPVNGGRSCMFLYTVAISRRVPALQPITNLWVEEMATVKKAAAKKAAPKKTAAKKTVAKKVPAKKVAAKKAAAKKVPAKKVAAKRVPAKKVAAKKAPAKKAAAKKAPAKKPAARRMTVKAAAKKIGAGKN